MVYFRIILGKFGIPSRLCFGDVSSTVLRIYFLRSRAKILLSARVFAKYK